MGLNEELDTHLTLIEFQYGINIDNKPDIIRQILSATYTPRRILSIALSLNHLFAVSMENKGLSLSLKIPLIL